MDCMQLLALVPVLASHIGTYAAPYGAQGAVALRLWTRPCSSSDVTPDGWIQVMQGDCQWKGSTYLGSRYIKRNETRCREEKGEERNSENFCC